MTYLLADDWYANHGLAPGDARLPQGTLQPTPGNLAPTPPIRGYFGPKPPQPDLYQGPARTVSPFAVSDIMWGVNGLGTLATDVPACPCGAPKIGRTADGWSVCQRGHQFANVPPGRRPLSGLGDAAVPGLLTASGPAQAPAPVAPAPVDPAAMNAAITQAQAQTQAIMSSAAATPSLTDQTSATLAAAADKMKQQLMIGAATNTAIEVGLQFIPIVGQVVAVLYGVVAAVVGVEYQKKAKQVLADVQNKINVLAAQLTTQYSQAQSDTIKAETPNAIALMLTGNPGCPSGYTCPVQLSTLVPGSAAVHGLGGAHVAGENLGNFLTDLWKDVTNPVQRLVKNIDVNARRLNNAVISAAQTVSGDAVLKKAQQAADQAWANASTQMNAQYNTQMAQLQNPTFLHNLDIQMACLFMCNSDYIQLANKDVALKADPSTGAITGVSINTSAGTNMAVPVLAAGAATMLVLSI